jgi:CRP-like cAMP-binding protein
MSKTIDDVSGASRSSSPYRRLDLNAAAVRVLEVDPDLGASIVREQRAAATSSAVARVLRFNPGPWAFRPMENAGLGALILEGMVLVRVNFADLRAHVELLGEGDVISPWHGMSTQPVAPCVVSARVISHLEIAFLDRGFTQRTVHWPEIHAALMQRLLGRARMMSMQSAINSRPRIEERLELTLWQLAYRFGRVTPEGFKLDLPLSHAQLAEIVCARRPSVTIAIARLREQGNLVLTRRHQWLLRGKPPARLAAAGADLVGI